MKQELKNTIQLKKQKQQKYINIFIYNSNISNNNFEYIITSNLNNRQYHILTSTKLYILLNKLYNRNFINL
jgi:hypothetical protein